jgi:hypothetical protein
MCKTNPIPRLRISDCGLRIEYRVAAGRLADGLPAQGPVVQTNPICRVQRGLRACHAKQSQFLPGALAGTNRANQTQFRRLAGTPEEKMRKTNPIPVGRGTPPHPNIPVFQSDADYAKRSQLRRSWKFEV